MKTRSYILLFALIINMGFSGYLFSIWVAAQPKNPSIPDALIFENDIVQSELLTVADINKDQRLILALLSAKASLCAQNKIADFYRGLDKNENNLVILFPPEMRDQDIATYKANFNLDVKISRMTPEMNTYWEAISEKYATPGLIVVSGPDGQFVSTNFSTVRKGIQKQ